LLGIACRCNEKEGSNQSKETIKKKVLEDIDKIGVCEEAKSEIGTS
jgi:hypothetical protein